MVKFLIEYNPYIVNCKFKKNDKLLKANSKIGAKSSERLQVLLGESTNWKGLVEEIIQVCNDRYIKLHFKGRKIDFDDLKYYIDRYHGDVKFELTFEEVIKDSDIMKNLDIIFNDIKKKNLPEFNVKNKEGINIFDAYEEVKNNIFEVNVIATMSSGKSTLINSLLNTELLPSENKACTATIATILENNKMDVYEAECRADDGERIVHPKQVVNLDDIKQFNKDENVTYIDIEGSIPAIPSNNIRLCLCDTPGPNNSMDDNHEKLTQSIIKRKNDVILYMINATQTAIRDDENLLRDISSEMKKYGKQSRDRFIFVVNKCDELDEEKGETVDKQVSDIKKYLKKFGIIEPIIIPTSAKLALLIRKNQRGDKLTRQERKDLNDIEYFVEEPLLHFEDYAVLTPTVRDSLKKDIENLHNSCDDENSINMEALIHTGVPAVEKMIAEYIEKYAYPMKINDAIKDILQILDELNMKTKFDEMIASDNEKFKKVRNQIEESKIKYENSKSIYNEYKEKIENLSLDSIYDENGNKFDRNEKLFQVENTLESMSRKYYIEKKEKVDKVEAERLISDFQLELLEYQKVCGRTLNRQIEDVIFKKCKEMLDEYSEMVLAILDDIEIEGYNFEKISSFKEIRINNIDDLIKRNQTDRYKKETKWKKNPARQGFLGFFKFWKPKEISYTEFVKDGVDVNIRKVVVDILNEFLKHINNNMNNMFKEADRQIEKYKELFKTNIDYLYNEIQKIIYELDKDTRESELIGKRVNNNKELAKWVDEKEKQICSLLFF